MCWIASGLPANSAMYHVMFILKVSQTFHLKAWHQVHWSMEGRSKRRPWTPGQAKAVQQHALGHLESFMWRINHTDYISMWEDSLFLSFHVIARASKWSYVPTCLDILLQILLGSVRSGQMELNLKVLVLSMLPGHALSERCAFHLRSMAEWPRGRVRKVCPC